MSPTSSIAAPVTRRQQRRAHLVSDAVVAGYIHSLSHRQRRAGGGPCPPGTSRIRDRRAARQVRR